MNWPVKYNKHDYIIAILPDFLQLLFSLTSYPPFLMGRIKLLILSSHTFLKELCNITFLYLTL